MEMKEKFYKEKLSKNKDTEIHYEMDEIKHIYPLRLMSNKEAWLWLYRRGLGLDLMEKDSSTLV
jgi:hypothetical protein